MKAFLNTRKPLHRHLHIYSLHRTRTACHLLKKHSPHPRTPPTKHLPYSSLICYTVPPSSLNVLQDVKGCLPEDSFRCCTVSPTARTAFEMPESVDVDSQIRLRTSSQNEQLSTPSSSSTSPNLTPTRSGTLCSEITQTFLTNSSAIFIWDKYRQSTPLPVLRVVVAFIPSQLTQIVDENFEVEFVSNHITLTSKSYNKDVIEVHSHNDHYTSLLNQTKIACIDK